MSRIESENVIFHKKNPKDAMHLQRELDAINKWAEENGIQFNAERF